MDFIVGDEELQRRFKALRDGTADQQLLSEFGLLAVQFAKDEVPRKTGNLGRTIRVAEVDAKAQRVRVVAGGSRNVGYAAYVEFGTGLYGPFHRRITPKRSQFLRFPGSGAKRLSGNFRSGAAQNYVYVRSVKGMQPRPYLVPGAKKALALVDKAKPIIETWNRAA